MCVKIIEIIQRFRKNIVVEFKKKSLLNDNFLSRKYVNIFIIEFENILIDFLLCIMRRMRKFDLRFIRIEIIRFSHVEIISDLFVKFIIISCDIIIFRFIKNLHFKSLIKWNSRLMWSRVFFSLIKSLNYKSNMT